MPNKPPGPRYSKPEELFEPGTPDYEAAVDRRAQRAAEAAEPEEERQSDERPG